MHSWRWFDQWISSSGRGEESYLFFYEIAGRSRSEPVGKIEDAPILNPRWEMQGHTQRTVARCGECCGAQLWLGTVRCSTQQWLGTAGYCALQYPTLAGCCALQYLA